MLPKGKLPQRGSQRGPALYTRRFSAAPNLVLVNVADVTGPAEIEVRSERTVQPHHFWVGPSDEQPPRAGANTDD